METFTGNERGLANLKSSLSVNDFRDFIIVLNAMNGTGQINFSSFISSSTNFITTGAMNPLTPDSPSEQGQFQRDSKGNAYININTAAISATHNTSHPEWSLGYHVAEIVLHEVGHAQDLDFASIGNAGSAQRYVAIGIRSEALAQIGAYEALASARANLLAQGTNVSASGGTLFDPSKPVTSFPAAESVIKLTALGLAIPEYANLLDDLTRDQLQEAAVALIMGRETSHDASGSIARGYGYFQYYVSQYRGANPHLAQFDLVENGEHRLTFDATGSSTHANMVNIQTGETTKTWEIKAFDDGSTLSTVTNRQTGEVSTFTTNATADNGTQVVTQGNGDQTRTDYIGGRAAETTEMDGARDNTDFDTRTSTYDAAGRVDFVDITRDDGSRDLSNRDQDGTQPWSRVDVHYDTQGRQDYSTVTMDDGSSIWSDFDQTGARADSLWQTGTDAQGRTDWVKATDDGGGFNWVDFDQSNVSGAARWESRTDALGRVDWMGTVMDDGSVSRVDYDEAAAQFWSRIDTSIDAQGRTDCVTVIADDGAQTWQDFDQENTRADSLYQARTDAQGRTDWVNVTGDDGGNVWVDYDELGAQDWQWFQSNSNVHGQVQSQTICRDDNSQARTTWDTANESGLSYRTQNIDAAGRMDDQWAYFDDGSRLHTDYNYYGANGHRLDGWDPTGTVHYLAQQLPSGLVCAVGRWNPIFGPAINLPGQNPNDGNYGGIHGPVDESYYLDSRNTYTDPGYEGPYYG